MVPVVQAVPVAVAAAVAASIKIILGELLGR